MLGWKVLDGAYDIKISLPMLSEEEEQFITKVVDVLRKRNIEDVNEEIISAIEEVAAQENVALDEEQVEYIFHIIKKTHFGLGFLEELLDNEEVEEIAIIGINKPVYVYLSKQGWKTVNVSITSFEYLVNLINKISLKSGRRITLKNPRLNANLAGLRLHATIKPISDGEITIRKFRSSPITIKDIEGTVYPSEVLPWLSLIMESDSSFVIGGNTGSGKTTFLNALFTFVPKNERIVIIEETPEISIAHEHQVRLVENQELGVTLKELVYDTLRMRSDRTIVGEVRKPDEVQALMDVVLSGQARGTYATFHANSIHEFISRLKSYGVLEEDINAIDFLAIQRRILVQDGGFKEVRRGIGIYHVPSRTALYEYSPKGTKINTGAFKRILAEKLWRDESEVEKAYQERKAIIERLHGSFQDQFHQYQIECFGI